MLLFWGAQRAKGWRWRRRLRAAHAAERNAERLFVQAGYRVVDRQARRLWPVTCDGTLREVELRADYILRQGRRTFVAEVKAGHSVGQLNHGPTRRQLLEYKLAFRVHAILLLDVHRGTLSEVDFPALSPATRTPGALLCAALLAGALFGATAMLVW